MEIPVMTQKKWWLCKKADALNSLNIAKWFTRNTEVEKFDVYRQFLYLLRWYNKDGKIDQKDYVTTHNVVVNMMLDDIDRLFGRKCWRIVRNNITFAHEEEE